MTHATVFRTAMVGGGLAYDVYIPIKNVGEKQSDQATRIHREGKIYIDYPQATEPDAILNMEKGWLRHAAWLEHEKKARVEMLHIAASVYPELTGLPTLPSLWITGLMKHETSDVRIAKVVK